MLSLLSTTARAQFAGGDGSPGNPYQIDSVERLNEIRNDLDAHYILVADIDLTTATGESSGAYWNGGEGWEPIGNIDNDFRGSIDGNGHVITGLFINRSGEDYVGLFANTGTGSDIMNIALEEVDITGNNYVGALVGRSYIVTVTGSYVTGSVIGNSFVGGLIGFSGNIVTITDSYAMSSVSGNYDVGGLMGTNNGTVTDSYATGRVSGTGVLGGLVGSNNRTVTDSYWNTETSEQASSAGGAGLTTAQMRQESNFTGFDFTDTWQIQEGLSYPVLQDNTQDPTPGFVFTEGAGSEAEPYEIANAEQLNAIRFDLDAHYILTANIDLTTATGDASGAYWNDGEGWVPIATASNRFKGSLNGNSHTITGLFIDRSDQNYIGLFGAIDSDGELSNIGMVAVDLTGERNVGGLVGLNYGTVT